jgi:hypothetical protein
MMIPQAPGFAWWRRPMCCVAQSTSGRPGLRFRTLFLIGNCQRPVRTTLLCNGRSTYTLWYRAPPKRPQGVCWLSARALPDGPRGDDHFWWKGEVEVSVGVGGGVPLWGCPG